MSSRRSSDGSADSAAAAADAGRTWSGARTGTTHHLHFHFRPLMLACTVRRGVAATETSITVVASVASAVAGGCTGTGWS